MPSNNGRTRRAERRRTAKLREIAANESGKSAAEREAERGYPRRNLEDDPE